MNRFLFLSFFTLVLPFQVLAQLDAHTPLIPGKEYTIAGITVTGTKLLDNEVLITLSRLQVGQQIRFPSEKIAKAIRDLWAQGLFDRVEINLEKIKADSIYLNLDLGEKPRLSRIVLQGVKKSERETLNDKLKGSAGKIIGENLFNNINYVVKKEFREKGYYNTQVNITENPDTTIGQVWLAVGVVKNQKTRVNEVILTGNKALSANKVKGFLKNTKERKFYKIFGSKKFIAEKFEEDKATLIAKYRSYGYRDVAILSDSIYQYDDKTVNIALEIKEGIKYYFGDIKWSGNAVYASKELARILQIKKGDVFDETNLDKRLKSSPSEDDISSLYLNNGYLFFQASPVISSIRQDTIDMDIQLFEGEQATINKINFAGNDRTSDKVVLREIRTKPGDKFDKSALLRTLRELSQLGYFDEQKITPDVVPNQNDGTVDITYNVVEKPSDQLELSGGYGGYSFIGTIGLTFNNFSVAKLFSKNWGGVLPSGDGQKLSIRGQTNGKQYQNYSLSFTEPWFGGDRRRSLSVSLMHSTYTVGRNESLMQNNISFSLGQYLSWPDDFFLFRTQLNLQRYDLNNWQNFDFKTGTAYVISVTPEISRNSTGPNPIYPTDGSHVRLSAQFTPPYSLLNSLNYSDPALPMDIKNRFTEFHKWKFDGSWFIKVLRSSNLVVNLRTHFGFLGAYNSQIALSSFERFQLGGDGMGGFQFLNSTEMIGMRGYGNNEIRPDGLTNQQGSPIYNKFVAELRHPVTLSQQVSIYALLFAEAGNTYKNFSAYNPFMLRRSAGIGLRLFMPIFGMIGIDWGYGFDPVQTGMQSHGSQFTFSISQGIGSGF